MHYTIGTSNKFTTLSSFADSQDLSKQLSSHITFFSKENVFKCEKKTKTS